ncbi:MAG: sodium:solute symporter [Candidatus Eisenbacteria bacterium]|nr:sodium:solute symporter [Candidatus Eisenbacteria bacterium]
MLDWFVLISFLVGMVVYGLWRGRRQSSLDGYLLSDRDMRWTTVCLSIMATQASAITFLSTPGQAYVDGMRFVQFYFGLPLAMIVLSITAVPIFHRLKVYTAYEYLEGRFDLKTRTLAAGLFLIQRGLACGLTIYAPALILSVLLGWSLFWTNIALGVLVVIYTASGGTRAVNHTNSLQMIMILFGVLAVLILTIIRLPPGMSVGDAVWMAGTMGKLNAIDTSFDWNSRYNLWSGLIGGFFLALSYFGTDQSQVGRYLSGQSITQSRLGLLANGMVKVPMQFVILFSGAMVFVFYLFTPPPVFFNSLSVDRVRSSAHASEFAAAEREYGVAHAERREALEELSNLRHAPPSQPMLADTQTDLNERVTSADQRAGAARGKAIDAIQAADPGAERRDVNYIFLTFVLNHLPIGFIGLVLACVFAASMSSTAAELNALASTTVVDFYRRSIKPNAGDRELVRVSKLSTLMWGGFAILFAEFASKLGSLIEAVNILGSLFYGTILGIFLLAFYVKRTGGTAVFVGALIGEAVVVGFFAFSKISFLWYNVIGCLVTMAAAWILSWIPATARKT